MTKDPLKPYRQKRDFRKTSEPKGSDASPSSSPVFVIQKHAASQLHYDFRLEVNGVLKSWAIPKGPSTDPRQKRLAVPTEDHPLEYGDFEGIIPEGEYGAGTVIVWDIGYYRNLMAEKDKPLTMDQALKKGHVEVWLEGKKIRGGYALIRTGADSAGRWLLIKMKDNEADARRNPVSTEPKSAISGRSIEDVRKAARTSRGKKAKSR